MSPVGLTSNADGRQSGLPRTGGESARFVLRQATAAAHERVDALFSHFDLTARDGYAAFLRGQAGAHLAVEAALDRAGAARVIADWPARRRADALKADLHALGVHTIDSVAPPSFAGEAGILGAAYVLEGSRLGGALLARSVPADLPTAFLTAGTAQLWRAFVSVLDDRLANASLIDEATAAALTTFAAYETSAQRALETARP